MPRAIVIHMGFHKTGTSSVQQVLRDNRDTLKPHMRSLLRGEMTDIVHAARGFSTWRDPVTLLKFSHRFGRLLRGLSPMSKRVLCLSAEELSGHLPGRDDLRDYSATPILAARMAKIATQVYPNAELVFFLSTRAPDPWIKSAYWQHVKSSSMTMEMDAFISAYPNAPDLDRIVDDTAGAVPCPVRHCRLEDSQSTPLGPATPLLELCGVPANILENIMPPAPANTQPDTDVMHQLLAANRKYTDRETRTAAKQAILVAAQEKQT